MSFDKKFEELSKLLKVVLLLIPFVNWVCEILIHVSAVLRNKSDKNIIGLVLAIVVNCIFGWADLIYVIIKDKNLLVD